MYLSRVEGTLCLMKALLHYITLQCPPQGPLFLLPDGSPLSRSILVTAMRSALTSCGVRADAFNGHSFCIGAATAAVEVGLKDSMIQKLGSWKSDAFMANIQIPQATLLSISPRLVLHRSTAGTHRLRLESASSLST